MKFNLLKNKDMKPEIVIAIIKSIFHYERIALGIDKSISGKYCALCKIFGKDKNYLIYGIKCYDGKDFCPIHEHTKLTGCRDTPWEIISILIHGTKLTDNINSAIWDQIEEEIEFLISLLPYNFQKEFNEA